MKKDTFRDNNGSSEITQQLISLLALTFTCIKGLVWEEKELQKGFDDLARSVKEVEDANQVAEIRTRYRNLLLLLDSFEAKREKTAKPDAPKKNYDLSPRLDEEKELMESILGIFSQGTRHLCDKGDLLTETLHDIEKKKFVFEKDRTETLIGNLKHFFLSKFNEIESAVKERAELKTIIVTLTETLESFSDQNSKYSSHLREYVNKIDEAVNLNDIIKVKEAIIVDTKKIVEESETFKAKVTNAEDNLNKASSRIKKLEEEIEKVKEASAIDPLTQAFNRGYFDRKIQEAVDAFSRYGNKTTFLMFDIDHFKRFNDTYGHQVGDKVLTTVASIIKKNTRKTDFFFRYGGEEFALILPNTNLMEGKELAEILRLGVNKHVFKYQGDPVSVSISLGMTLFKQGDTTAKIIERADKALYQAKGNGRNRLEIMY